MTQYRSYTLLATAIIALYGVSAQICPSDSSNDSFYDNEGLIFPYNSNPFDVSDNQQHRWLLQLNSGNFYAISVLLNEDNRYAGLTATLYDTTTGTSYPFTASGTYGPFGLRSSPDYKWATLYDVFMNGTSSDGSLNFNVSISYADFWSDSPANDIFNSKQVQYFDNSLCTREILSSGGSNFVQSKGFWIAFDFNDGSHLYFNVPPGPSASLYRTTFLFFDQNCDS
eukprot:TRINITY_DN9728_c0_g1_i1.p1 TRINITY_DN9728_c0_g1~~TRINITY_DN9728_c0_g1_i1.p1  ORF type:complete len:226 (+),score=17.71 TRINITY_DN9728_c0_g1_i1:140-817(+)